MKFSSDDLWLLWSSFSDMRGCCGFEKPEDFKRFQKLERRLLKALERHGEDVSKELEELAENRPVVLDFGSNEQ